jgi:VCBS repeat-containing protein
VRFLTTVLDQITDAMQQVTSRRYAQDRLLLRSPDGTVYAVSVDNAGTISTAVVDGKDFD